MNLTQEQSELVDLPIDNRIFIEGLAGAGKTTAAILRLQKNLEEGLPGYSVLILLPQRTLGYSYQNALSSSGVKPGGIVTLLTPGGLAQRMVRLFWPLVSEQAGFAKPYASPTFLTLETAQYYMARLVTPLLEEGYFSSVVIEQNRLFSQIVDNLNKAAVVGFPHTDIGERLKAAWAGNQGQMRVFDDVQACANQFRQTCLNHNLLDYSLQVEVFWKYVWHLPICKEYLFNAYHHIIADNIEEDTPFAHELLTEWLPYLGSALLIYDNQAGFRRILGADPEGAYLLKSQCNIHQIFDESLVSSTAVHALSTQIEQVLEHRPIPLPPDDPRPALEFHSSHYYPQMIYWVAKNIASLIHDQGISPSEIVILAPYLSDALRYGLTSLLEKYSIPFRSYRPSRSLREEPVTHVLLSLAKLAHPNWNFSPSKSDLAFALQQTIEGLDLVRSHLLAEIVFRVHSGMLQLQSFDQIIPETQERITYLAGERYENLRRWLEAYRTYPPLELDHFIATIFGEVLSQPGYRYHTSIDSGSVTARLIESIQKFRSVASATLLDKNISPAREYIIMVENGVIAAQSLGSWQRPVENAVLLSPAHTFLMNNYPVAIQFWMDISSRNWSDRLAQPLTNPYVLSRSWPRDKKWTDNDEVETSQEAFLRLITGLLRRCRKQVFLGFSDLSEQGNEQRGPLIRIMNRILQNYVSQ